MPGTGQRLVTSYLLFKDSGYSVDSIRFDLLLDEQHSLEAEVTQHTVEDGSTISDHIRILPRKGSLTGFVTNHPFVTGYNGGLPPAIAQKIAASQKKDWVSGFVQDIGSSYNRLGQVFGQQDGTKFTEQDFQWLPARENRVDSTWSAFKALLAAKKPCAIVTGLETYLDVVVTKVSTERDKDSGDAQRFKVEFQAIEFATIAEVALSNVVRPDFSKSEGKQATQKKKGGKTAGKSSGPVKLVTSSDGKRYLLTSDGRKIPVLAGSST